VILAVAAAYVQKEFGLWFIFEFLQLSLKILFNLWNDLVMEVISEGVVGFDNVLLIDLLLGQLRKFFVVKLAHVFF
jgi:hypothetical protein